MSAAPVREVPLRVVPSPPVLGLRFVFAFAVLAIGPSFVWDVLVKSGIVGEASSDRERLEASMLGWTVTCLCIAGLAKFQLPAMSWRPARYAAVLRAYVPFVVLWVGFLFAYLALARGIGHPVPPQPALGYLASGDFARPGFWLVVLGTTIAAPIAEEIVFRGYLQGALLGMLPRWGAIAISAAVFGAVHTWPYALPVGLLGALFGWLALRHGSLWPAILAHATHNSATVAITVLWPGHLDLLYPR
ncbi:MAG: CPBP family intramembrane glutamic endopeptidase [Planctomycetota bacterium]